jgi:F-type H+-transporting ATPase subunit c
MEYAAYSQYFLRRLRRGLRGDRPRPCRGAPVAAAMDAIARQPDAANTISRTLFVGLAMIETTAIYCLVIALLLLFANPLLG